MVLYFSGTGNSRYVARQIAQITDDEVISINQRLKKGDYRPIKANNKPLTFVGPIYGGRLPRVMDNFIRQVNFQDAKRVYFIGTCAKTPWLTVEYVKKLCNDKNFALMGFNSIVMPQGYVARGGTQPKDVNDRILAAAEPKITQLATLIRANQLFPSEQPGKATMSRVLNPILYMVLGNTKPFYVTDKCISCGKCAQRCPLNNVKITDGKPVWGKECTQCMACIAGCPTEAIEYGKKTIGKLRYYLGEE